MSLNKIEFLGIKITRCAINEFIEYVLQAAQIRQKTFITYVNAHCVNFAFRDADYRQILQQADVVYADGQAIIWAARFLGERLPERVNAGDFFPEFVRRCATANLKLFLLGSYPGVASSVAERLQRQIPELEIVGTHHGFITPAEEPELVSRINNSGADILLVGMGVPRQEKWAFSQLERLAVPVVWCVGALFEYYGGHRARAPQWVRRCGMEWLFRLILEPRRLWRRYILGNPEFVWRVLVARLKKTSVEK